MPAGVPSDMPRLVVGEAVVLVSGLKLSGHTLVQRWAVYAISTPHKIHLVKIVQYLIKLQSDVQSCNLTVGSYDHMCCTYDPSTLCKLWPFLRI